MTIRPTARRRRSRTFVEKAILSADPQHPTKDPVPYTGIQYVGIPEFQAMGTQVGQQIARRLPARRPWTRR